MRYQSATSLLADVIQEIMARVYDLAQGEGTRCHPAQDQALPAGCDLFDAAEAEHVPDGDRSLV